MNKFVRVSVIGFMTLSTILWSSGVALAVSVAGDYTNTGAATVTVGRGDTNRLVMNILLNNDVLITNGGGASAAGDALVTLQGATDPVFVDGTTNDNTYTNGEPVIYSVDLTLDAGVLSGAGTDDVLIAGPSDIKPFPGTIYGFDDSAGTNGAYDAGEALVSSADTNLTNGDTVVTAGKADVTNFAAGDNVLFDAGAEWDTGVDDIFIDLDNDDVFTTALDTLLDGDGAGTAGVGTLNAAAAAGDALDAMADNIGTAGVAVCTDSLASPTAIRLDIDGDCTNNAGTDGTYVLGTLAIPAVVEVTAAWAFGDDATMGGNADNAYDLGEDIFLENVAGQLTYSAGIDTVLYNGSGTLTLGDAGTEMNADPEAIFLDSNHDTNYDDGEPIIDLGNGNTLADDGDLPLTAIFLAKATGNWTVDWTAMNDAANADIGYADSNHGGTFTTGEAVIMEAAAAATDAVLETTDVVTSTGSAELTQFPTGFRYVDVGAANYDAADDIYFENDNTGDGDNVVDKLQLNSITVQNAGTAVFNDISAVHVWWDADNNGTFSAALDTDLGTMTADANGWALTGLTQALSTVNSRLFVTVNIYSGADDNRTIQMRIPVRVDGNANGTYDAADEGIFVDAASTVGDGPSDAVLLNANTQTIDVPATSGSGADVTAPAAPFGVTAQGTGVAGQIKLMWTNPTASDFTGVRIFRSQTAGVAAANGAIIVDSTTGITYTDTNLVNGATYYYVLRSMDSSGNYNNSSEVSAVAGSVASSTTTTTTTPTTTTTTPTTTTTTTTPTTTTGTSTTTTVVTTAPSTTLKPLPYLAPTTNAEKQANLSVLIENVAVLQAALKQMQGLAIDYVFNKDLYRGLTSDSVRDLQNILHVEGVYPENIVSGYFGALTEAAVKKFQAKYSISQTGYVGPITRAQLNALY